MGMGPVWDGIRLYQKVPNMVRVHPNGSTKFGHLSPGKLTKHVTGEKWGSRAARCRGELRLVCGGQVGDLYETSETSI